MIETARLRLRPPHARDGEAVEHLFNDPDVMRHYAHIARPGFGAIWLAAVDHLSAVNGYAPWTVELRDGTFVGQCGPLTQEIEGKREVEIVCFFERAFWRSGYADEAMRAAIDAAFERIDLPRVIGLVYPQNRPSARLALRCGFAFERDVVVPDGATMGLYALKRLDWNARSETPLVTQAHRISHAEMAERLMNVGIAKSAGTDPDDDLVRGGLGHRDLGNDPWRIGGGNDCAFT